MSRTDKNAKGATTDSDRKKRNLSKVKEEYLRKLYTDPGNPGSFSGLRKLEETVKKEGLHKINRNEIKTFLEKQDTYTVNRFVRRKFKRIRVIAYGINDLVDIDLADFSRLARYNNNVRFLLVAIDVFSRFVKVRALKNKSALSVLDALKSVYGSGPVPRKIRSDRGAEVKNRLVAKYFEKKGIRHVFASAPIKAGYAERCIQSLKQLVYRYLFHNNTFRYVDVLDQIVANYNSRPHRSLGNLAPDQVSEKNQTSLWNDMYINRLQEKKSTRARGKSAAPQARYTFDKGQLVRISYAKSPFERSYQEKFTEEVFVVTGRFLHDNIPVYKLADLQNSPVEGFFYGPELQRTDKSSRDQLWVIERVLKTVGKGKNQKVLVRWKGYGPSFDSYVLKSSIQNIS
ncbi:MAG: DDE-type integrase/transposase/recombinase [Candidatus Thiodiazotropha sp.]